MAYRVKTASGLTIEVDTPDELGEALAAAEKRAAKELSVTPSQPQAAKNPVAQPTQGTIFETEDLGPVDQWGTFVRSLTADGRKTLKLWKMRGSADLETTVAHLGAKNNMEFSGTLSGIVKAAKKTGIDPDKVFGREQEGKGPKRQITYHAGPLLREREC